LAKKGGSSSKLQLVNSIPNMIKKVNL